MSHRRTRHLRVIARRDASRARIFNARRSRLRYALILAKKPATLVLPQACIDAVSGEQFGMGALLDDAPVIHDD